MTIRSPLTVEEQVAKRREYMHHYNQAKRDDVFRKTDAAYHRYYRREHREKCAEYVRRCRRSHPEYDLRRVSLTNTTDHFTAEEFELKCKEHGNKCTYCERELLLTADHAIPLSRGGSGNIENIVPACKECNSKKNAMTYDEFMERISTPQTV